MVITANSTLTFKSTEASFAPAMGGSGMSGMLMQANPADTCSTLDVNESSTSPLILLTMRGNCAFDLKVQNAQSAGFLAVVIYASDYSSPLLTMAGNPEGIYVHALYVTREAGEALLKYVEDKNSEIWLLPTDESSLWSIEVLLFVVVLAFGAALATWLITKSRRIRRLCSRLLKQQEPCVMRSHIVKAMPSITYRVVAADHNAGREACGICLEDYKANQTLRILPCNHRFHSRCVDTWLTAWQASCPICKCDIWFDLSDLGASERTPLLRSTSVGGVPKPASSEVQLHSNSINISSSSQHKSETSSHKCVLQCGTSSIKDGVSNSAISMRTSSPICSLTAFCVYSDSIPSSPSKP